MAARSPQAIWLGVDPGDLWYVTPQPLINIYANEILYKCQD